MDEQILNKRSCWMSSQKTSSTWILVRLNLSLNSVPTNNAVLQFLCNFFNDNYTILIPCLNVDSVETQQLDELIKNIMDYFDNSTEDPSSTQWSNFLSSDFFMKVNWQKAIIWWFLILVFSVYFSMGHVWCTILE